MEINLVWHTEQRKVKDLKSFEGNPRLCSKRLNARLCRIGYLGYNPMEKGMKSCSIVYCLLLLYITMAPHKEHTRGLNYPFNI